MVGDGVPRPFPSPHPTQDSPGNPYPHLHQAFDAQTLFPAHSWTESFPA